jgi:predicted P-loop ATPase
MNAYTLAQFDAILGAVEPASKPPFTIPTDIPAGDRHDVLHRFLRSQKARKVSLAVALAGCRQLNTDQCKPPIPDAELTEYLTRIWEEDDGPKFKELSKFVRDTHNAIVKDHQGNVRHALTLLEYKFFYQSFAEKMLVQNGKPPAVPLDDHVVNTLWLRIDREYKFRPTFMFFEKVLKDVAHDRTVHPVQQYLDGLKWDGIARIDTWLTTYGGAVDLHPDASDLRSYLEAVSSIVLIAAVRRVRHPGCKYDEMLVLESQQGLNKSSALRALCPEDEWFSDDLPLNVDAKQIIERTLGKWIIEASDLVGGRKADRDHLKAMLSRQIDGPARLAYAHLPVERPRQFIIIGTTNSDSYLADMTGARRFWPVKVKKFDIEAIRRDRDQLWAEAAAREKAGESIRLDESLWSDAGLHQEARREVDAWEETIDVFLDTLVAVSGRKSITADALWVALNIPVERRDRYGAKRIAEIMQRFGFERTNVRDAADKVKTGYVKTAKNQTDFGPLEPVSKPAEPPATLTKLPDDIPF